MKAGNSQEGAREGGVATYRMPYPAWHLLLKTCKPYFLVSLWPGLLVPSVVFSTARTDLWFERLPKQLAGGRNGCLTSS